MQVWNIRNKNECKASISINGLNGRKRYYWSTVVSLAQTSEKIILAFKR
jgi:hypothetical protein